ncbi:MAG: amino acid ABC transporter substrate-binding protein [Treponema sp.]|nr:amino acid ABC transporter substrate-binding protein [Treponema sp.]
MKKIALICAALLALTLTGCKKAEKTAGGDNSVAELKARGTFVLGLDDSFPPLGYRNDDNEIVGYDIDLGKEVAKRLGVTFKAQPIDWDAKEMELNTKRIDCIWNGFTMTDERINALSFTKAYLNNEQVLVVRAKDNIKSLADMKGKVVGVQSGSSAQDAVDENTSFKDSLGSIVFFKENVTALNDLGIGGVDGVVMDSVVANYAIAEGNLPYVIVDEALSREAYGIGFRKEDAKLRDEVQKILEEMAKDGTVAKISNKWFGKDISVIGK